MFYPSRGLKLDDCRRHGPHSGAELFLVEGDSAAASVSSVRDELFQAVLPMQGKPVNTRKASAARIEQNPWLQALFQALGCGTGLAFDVQMLRYERVMLLFDPDADGIHCGALMLICFQHLMPQLLSQGRVHMVRAPLMRITSLALTEPLFARSPAHHQHMLQELEKRDIGPLESFCYRGLGSLERTLLIEQCVDPETRHVDVMTDEDAAMARDIFGTGD